MKCRPPSMKKHTAQRYSPYIIYPVFRNFTSYFRFVNQQHYRLYRPKMEVVCSYSYIHPSKQFTLIIINLNKNLTIFIQENEFEILSNMAAILSLSLRVTIPAKD